MWSFVELQPCFSFIMTSQQCFQNLAACAVDRPLLPCLPPASTLQVDVNGDAEWPPGRSRVQEHARSYLSHLPAQSTYIHLMSSSLSESQMSFFQQMIISYLQQAPMQRGDSLSGLVQFIHRATPCCLPRLKGERSSTFHPHVGFYRNHHR